MYTSRLLYPSSVDGHLGCFHILTIVNSAAMNIRMHVASQVQSFYPLFPIVCISPSERFASKNRLQSLELIVLVNWRDAERGNCLLTIGISGSASVSATAGSVLTQSLHWGRMSWEQRSLRIYSLKRPLGTSYVSVFVLTQHCFHPSVPFSPDITLVLFFQLWAIFTVNLLPFFFFFFILFCFHCQESISIN